MSHIYLYVYVFLFLFFVKFAHLCAQINKCEKPANDHY